MRQLVESHMIGANYRMMKNGKIQMRVFLPNGRTVTLTHEQAQRIANALGRCFDHIKEERGKGETP
jgi:hypothetical protein